MSINYYSTTGSHDWRLDVFSNKILSYLQIVGSEELKGTIKHAKKYLKCSSKTSEAKP